MLISTAPSPFSAALSTFQTAWDSTSLGWFKTCPRYYQYNMLLALSPVSKSIHLSFGGWYAAGLEVYAHRRAEGLSHDAATVAMVRWVLNETWDTETDSPWEPPPDHKDASIKNRANLIRSLVWNVEERLTSPFTTVILSNGKPAVELSFNFPVFEIAGEQISLSGHLDEVVEADGQYWVRDDKTTKGALNAQYFGNYSPNPQMTLYTIAGKVILDAPVRGVLVKAAQIGVNFTRFVTQQIPRPAAVLTEWLTDTKLTIELARQYAEANYWPMNDTSCSRFGGCPYQKVCNLSPSHRQAWLDQDFESRPWNPLAARGDV